MFSKAIHALLIIIEEFHSTARGAIFRSCIYYLEANCLSDELVKDGAN